MKFSKLRLAALVVAAPFLAIPAQAAAPPDDVVKATLSNGLQVVVVENSLAPVVSTDLAYRVGSRDDPPAVPGMAHAQEHMMFRGTHDLTTAQLGTIATALGGNFNAETSDTLTQYEFTVPAADLDAVLRIESDRMRDVLDLQSQWENERGAIEQEVLRDESAPGSDFFRDAQAYVFAGTPYAREGVGTVAAFNRLTGPEIKKFHDRWYAPNNAVLVIAGDVDARAVLARVRAYFESVPRHAVPAHPLARFGTLERRIIRRPTTLVYALASVVFRFPGSNSPDFLAAYMLQEVLQSARGPLHELVDSGAALDAEWVNRPYVPEGQLSMASVALEPGSDPYAMTTRVEGILHRFATAGVPRELFETTKRHSITSQELGRNSISALASDWATTIALDDEPTIKREQELIAQVTLAEVNRAAKKYLDTSRALIGALTPSPYASQGGAPQPDQGVGPEKPLDVASAVTTLPAWGDALLEHIPVPAAETAPARSRLPNGLTIIVRPAQISDSVLAYGGIHTNAAIQEPEGKEGVASVLSAMFAFGTRDRDRVAFQRAQDDADTDLRAGASFGMETTSGTFERGLALLAEAELHPRFDAATFEVARRRVVGELQTALSGTGTAADLQLEHKLLPPGDPGLRRPTPDSLLALTLDDVRAYYAKTFRPDHTTIVVVGNVSTETARSAVEARFGTWKNPDEAVGSLELPSVPLNAPGDVHVPAPSLSQDNVRFTELVAVDRTSSHYAAMELANTIFGGGTIGAEQSRLFRDIRQNAGLVYSIASEYAPQRGRATFAIDFASSAGNLDRISRQLDSEIANMQAKPPGAFELSLAKAAVVRRTAIDLSSLGAIGDSLLAYAQAGEPLDQDRRDAEAIVATSGQAVRAAFADYVRPEDFIKVIVGP